MFSDTWFDTVKLVLLGLIWNSYRNISDQCRVLAPNKNVLENEWKLNKTFLIIDFFCSVMYLTTIFSYLGDWLGEKKLIKTRPVGKSKKEKVSNWWQKNKVSNWRQKKQGIKLVTEINYSEDLSNGHSIKRTIWIPDC